MINWIHWSVYKNYNEKKKIVEESDLKQQFYTVECPRRELYRGVKKTHSVNWSCVSQMIWFFREPWHQPHDVSFLFLILLQSLLLGIKKQQSDSAGVTRLPYLVTGSHRVWHNWRKCNRNLNLLLTGNLEWHFWQLRQDHLPFLRENSSIQMQNCILRLVNPWEHWKKVEKAVINNHFLNVRPDCFSSRTATRVVQLKCHRTVSFRRYPVGKYRRYQNLCPAPVRLRPRVTRVHQVVLCHCVSFSIDSHYHESWGSRAPVVDQYYSINSSRDRYVSLPPC